MALWRIDHLTEGEPRSVRRGSWNHFRLGSAGHALSGVSPRLAAAAVRLLRTVDLLLDGVDRAADHRRQDRRHLRDRHRGRGLGHEEGQLLRLLDETPRAPWQRDL